MRIDNRRQFIGQCATISENIGRVGHDRSHAGRHLLPDQPQLNWAGNYQ